MSKFVVNRAEFSYPRSSATVKVKDLVIDSGLHFVIGPNGSGKSTLLKLLAGVERPAAGSIEFDGSALSSTTSRRQYFAKSGYLPQDYHAQGRVSVAHYLTYRAWLHGMEPAHLSDFVERLISESDLTNVRERPVSKLSGGMNRRVGIAAEIVHQPTVLILDEPDAGLDVEAQHALWSMVVGYANADTAVIVSTHNAMRISSSNSVIHTIKDGELRRSVSNRDGSLSREAIEVEMGRS